MRIIVYLYMDFDAVCLPIPVYGSLLVWFSFQPGEGPRNEDQERAEGMPNAKAAWKERAVSAPEKTVEMNP